MKPRLGSQSDLVRLLTDAVEAIRAEDSFEGGIRWEYLGQRTDGDYAISAVYRVGNSMGQGGVVVYGDTDPPQPVDARLPLRGLIQALDAHLNCPDCLGTGRLQGRGADCVSLESLEMALTEARQAEEAASVYFASMRALGVDTAA